MVQRTLQGCRVLVVEDEYMLAIELREELIAAGAAVLGPVGRSHLAMELIEVEPHIDGAILDINLGGENAYPLADLLVARAVPLVFITGYDASVLPSRFADVPNCEKPFDMARVTRAIGRIIHT
jgi:two-component SAPR family response regulator